MKNTEIPDKNISTLSSIVDMGENMPGGFFIYCADGEEELLYANDIMLDIFGCQTLGELKELTGYTFKGLVHPDDIDSVEQSIKEQIHNNEKHLDYVEYRIKRKNGEIRWVDDYGRLIHTKDCGDVYFVLIRDITESHLLREENQRRLEVIEGLSSDYNSIYLINLDNGDMHPYRLKNQYFYEITSQLNTDKKDSSDEPSTANWKQILPFYAEHYVHPDDKVLFLNETSEKQMRERLFSESSYTVNYRYQEKDSDETIYMEMSMIQIKQGALNLHAVMAYRDITKNILQVRKELQDKLTIEMQLAQEKHANELKSSFLFNISHDIRTPMNAIMGFTNLAKQHINDTERLQDYLNKVDKSNQHMLSLIDDLLEMSSIDYGRIDIKSDRCNLKEQLEIVFDMGKLQIEEKQITLEKDLNLPETAVYTDSARFCRIMENLFSNAIKFTPPHGKIKVSAYQRQVSESGYARYEFIFSDNGIGMSEEFMKRMYDAFEQEETSTKTGFIGTGLGLSITKGLLDVMGGTISAKSKKGEGSVFRVDLPLKLALQEKDNDVKQAILPEIDTKSDIDRPYRILLVEDVEINRMLAETIMEDAGFSVESVPDGCDAVEIIKNHPAHYYDLVLMDIQMPVMNGYEATRLIRAMGRHDTDILPIIALSANAREEDKKMSIESGMNAHIAKPFDIANLIATVNDHIANTNTPLTPKNTF